MRNKLFLLTLFFFTLGVFAIQSQKPSHAMFVDGGGGGGFGSTIYVYAYNSGTTWKTHLVYYQASTRKTFTNTISSGTSWNLGFTINANDTLSWLTACVDPESNITNVLYVHCKSWDAASTTNCQSSLNAADPISCGIAFGACGGPNDYPSAGGSGAYSSYATNLGTVAYSLCPIPNKHPGRDSQSDENKFRCAYGGHVTGVGYVGCRNTCTYRQCGGTSTSNVYFYDTTYSLNCGSASTCTPPAPNITATTSCSGSTASIVASWNDVSYATTYDFRYRVSGGTWSSIVNLSGSTISRTISGLPQGTSYEVNVRAHTAAGKWGPTAWDSYTITTASCVPPPLPPTGLAAQPFCSVNASLANFSWNAVSGATSYQISWAGQAAQTTSTNSYTINPSCTTGPGGCSLTYNSSVPWNVKACNSGGCSSAVSGPTFTSYTCTSPTCSLSANPTNIYGGQTSALTASGSTTATGSVVNYSWPAPSTGTTDNNTCTGTATCTSTYHAPATVSSITTATVNVKNCNSAGGACTSCSTNVTLNPTSTITAHVYNDFNGNGVEDAVDTPSVGRTATVTGKGAGTYTTNGSGNAIITGLTSGNSTITITIPSGWTATTTNPRTIANPPSQTVNFGIKPPAPTCSGGLTANPTTVHPGNTSTLTAVGCTSPTGDPLTYNWGDDPTIAGDSVNPTTGPGNTSTWTAPLPWWTQVVDHPTVSVCNPGNVCTSYTTAITIIPLFTISGNVFEDQNKDGLQNGSDKNYTSSITITSSGGSVTYPAPAGNYLISNLTGGSYTVSSAVPARYQTTEPENGPPPYFTVRVGGASTGGACTAGGSKAGACDANGNITTLRFGISNSLPWIQSIGGDITGPGVAGTGGISNPIPAAATCGSYSSLQGPGGYPGMIYSGAGTADFNGGQASPDPFNWVVGGFSYPEPIKVDFPLVTSYANVLSLAQGSGTVNNLANYCGAGGITDCRLQSNLAKGFYLANGDLNLTGPSYTFPGGTSDPRNYIIMVNGDLNINTEVHVPIGDTAFFTAAGNINVDEAIGEATTTSTRSNVEGYYSSDHFFYVKGVNSCPTTDLRLNIAGSVIVNAVGPSGASTFVNQRDLCAQDLQCPAIGIIERPDFVLYSPEYLRIRRVWQEVAP